MKDHQYENRKFVLGGIALIVVVTYIVRLAFLQLMNEDYKAHADSNAFLNNVIFPARGVIYDRNGELLVYNQPAYDIMVMMREVQDLDTLDFCQTLGITQEEFDQRMRTIKDGKNYSSYTQQLFVGQIPAKDFSVFQEKLFRFRGFYVRERTIRRYAFSSAAHVLGDVAEVSSGEIEKDAYYAPGDYIGKQGVECSYETELRGEKGVEVLLRDAYGRIQGHYRGGKYDRKPVPGKNITLSIDIKLQQLGERLMEGKKGAIVAIEPKTGEVLAMVSAPSYDARLMEGKERGKKMVELQRDPLHPLVNRAVQGFYPPGSTFKTAQALTFLQEGIITPETAYPCSHGFRFGRLKVGCHGHPAPLALEPAIATSCNGYFCWGLYYMLGNRKKYSSVQDAMTTWKDYMVDMGFGYKLGIDMPGEARGLIPNASFYNDRYGNSWSGLTIISISIGQGEVALTPLQIANLGATIANRGYYITPHVVKGIEGGQLADSVQQKHRVKVDKEHYERVVAGMRRSVLGGTCRTANNGWYEVCGKTGTAQNKGHDHSVFMGFAPRTNPQIAIAVYVENGGWGATYGVPIGALMMEQYIRGELSPASEAKAQKIQERHISYDNS
ncbi:MAG: penicillin-binding protein 2 [Bacteroidaceae bacterium]|nr:penicillin-binding protein 2 [Bacteroidaceae bacterium]